MNHDVQFIPSGRGKAQCPADPNFPNGVKVDISLNDLAKCKVDLPYPAPECGFYLVTCKLCGRSVAITAVGRADDPTEVTIDCNLDSAKTVPQ